MKGKFIRQYRNAKGNLVFVYQVSGSEKQIQEFEDIQGENLRTDDAGNPLFFTIDFHGNSVALIITTKGKIVADTSNMDKVANLASRYEGTQLGQEIAKAGAAQLLAGIGVSVPESTTVASSSKDEGSDSPSDI